MALSQIPVRSLKVLIVVNVRIRQSLNNSIFVKAART